MFVRACRAVGEFLNKAGPEDRALALEALQIAVRAVPTKATLHGIVPFDPDLYCHADVHANACRPVRNRSVAASRSASRSASLVPARCNTEGFRAKEPGRPSPRWAAAVGLI
jgi:hypothetical protein